MASILVLFAHPALEKSRVHRRLLQAAAGLPGIYVHDLYEAYPDFDIDVRREQELLLTHQLVVLQYPLYWYSTPAILKQWMDLVLEHGWAYGRSGTRLRGKQLQVVTSAGGGEQAYQVGGFNQHPVSDFLFPIEQTARLCGMTWLPPYVVLGSHRMNLPEIDAAAAAYRRHLEQLRDTLPVPAEAP